ncbi:MAG TPA: T9SS type A sorting domain-containing protein [Ignavibacteria bacterium]
MKHSKTLSIFMSVFLVLFAMSAFAQDGFKNMSETQSTFVTSHPEGIQPNGPQLISPDTRNKIQDLTLELNKARINSDVQKARQLEVQINKLSGSIEKSGSVIDGPKAVSVTVNKPVEDPNKMNFTVINGYGNWSIATSTDRVNGRIWAISTQYSGSPTTCDTMRIYSSTNNGLNWFQINYVYFVSSAVKFRNDELDIEAMNDGTNSWLGISAGFDFGGLAYSWIARIKFDGTSLWGGYLNTSAVSATNKFYYPRIASDNATFTSNSYLMGICTQDSTLSAGLHFLRTKYAIIMNPFAATPTLTYRNLSVDNSYWWTGNGGDTTVMWNDIAYADSAGYGRVITVTNFYQYPAVGIRNLYMTYSYDYGATIPLNRPAITEANVNWKPKLAFSGGSNATPNGIIAYVRQYSATDWDAYYQRTTNWGNTWSGGYIDGSADTTWTCDVQAIKGSTTGQANITWVNFAGSTGVGVVKSKVYYGTSTFGAIYTASAFPSATLFGSSRAGYRLGAADSCLTMWSGAAGVGLYATAGCTGIITGIGNENNTPLVYSLNQNYPNPFNPVTKISYAIPVTGLVTLKVYDITGKEVASLVNEVKAAGNYIVDFNGANLSSGAYFYKLESGSFSAVKKLMLIK